MVSYRNVFAGLMMSSTAILLSACDGGVDLDINAPILEAAGVNIKESLIGKPAPEPDLPDRGPLVLPPKSADLPAPGQAPQPVANRQWPVDPVDAKKEAAKLAAEKKEKYCRDGDWSGKGNIDEFNKAAGQQPRCRPKWVEKAIGSDDQKKTQ